MGLPSRCTVHAPHCPSPHPNLGPVSCSSSCNTYNSGVSGAATTLRSWLLTVSFRLFSGWFRVFCTVRPMIVSCIFHLITAAMKHKLGLRNITSNPAFLSTMILHLSGRNGAKFAQQVRRREFGVYVTLA